MEPFTEISLVETAMTKCHLIQTPAGFDLAYQQSFPLNRADIHSLVYFLEKVRAEQHVPHEYAHGHLLLAYAPEEAFNEVAVTYENRRITMELATAFLLLDSLKDRGPA
ncbi:MAG: hypothetical protein M3Y39_21070 [Chloroflexota bacterium]|nr:hypothetical protein [Chloroflexota bacterium]